MGTKLCASSNCLVWRVEIQCVGTLCAVALNANRHVTGTLRGFDQFMNLVLDNTVDDKTKSDIGMVVRSAICSYGGVHSGLQ